MGGCPLWGVPGGECGVCGLVRKRKLLRFDKEKENSRGLAKEKKKLLLFGEEKESPTIWRPCNKQLTQFCWMKWK